jgi:predicted porin
MKKSLLAVAALTAFAGAAQAQSSVTVYGILDVGYVGGNAKDGSGAAETVSQFGQSAENSSRLGFKGTEDLGGGLSAFFTVETGLTPNDSAASTWNNRQSFVGLGKKGLGKAAIGTQYTTLHDARSRTSPTGSNNVVGDLIYPQSSGLIANDNNASGNSVSYTVRANNMIKFNSDKFAGFSAAAFYKLKNKDSNQSTPATAANNVADRTGVTGGTNNSTGYGLGVDYTWKKLLVTAQWQSFKTEAPYSSYTNTTPVTNAAGNVVSGTTSVSGTSGNQDNQYYFGATYDFGILKAYAQYVNRKVTSNLDGNDYVSRSAQQIGVKSFITPKIEAWASGATGRWNANGSGQPTANIVGYQLGSNYWLSKRTNLYAIFGSNATSSTTNNVSYNANNYALGVRHTF